MTPCLGMFTPGVQLHFLAFVLLLVGPHRRPSVSVKGTKKGKREWGRGQKMRKERPSMGVKDEERGGLNIEPQL